MNEKPHRVAFETLINDQLDSLYNSALRLTRNRQEAEDLLQDTVVKALSAIDRFQTGTNFKAWIYTILMNTFISRYRQRIKEAQVPLELVEEPKSNHPGPSDWIENLLGDEMENAFKKLPEVFRAPMELVDLQEFSYRDASLVLRVPVGTLMSRLSRGRSFLRHYLEESSSNAVKGKREKL